MFQLLKLLDGWKTIAAYLSAQLFSNMPMLGAALEQLAKNPGDKQYWLNFLVQAALAYGVADILRKRLEKLSNKYSK